MKILIVGTGFTGCTLARILHEKGHKVRVIDRERYVGGLCWSLVSPYGIIYEPRGSHIFHTKEERVKKFIQGFSKLNSYIHKKGVIIFDKLWHFPISMESIMKMPCRDQILFELRNRPKEIVTDNFETAMVSVFGRSLYNLFIFEYSKKMWGMNPRKLTAEWAPKRLGLRKKDSELFLGEWQGLPIGGYTLLFEKMLKGIDIKLNCSYRNHGKSGDLVIFTGRIDEMLRYKFGVLPYRGARFAYFEDEEWENDNYGTINLPEHPRFIKKVNFNVLHQQENKHSLIQYHESIEATEDDIPMYPVNTVKNNWLFDIYLRQACNSSSIIPAGRLGLYKYLNMDKSISLAMDMVELVFDWKKINCEERYFRIKELLAKY